MDIANDLGVHRSLLSAILNEAREPSPDFEKRITKAMTRKSGTRVFA